MKERGIITMTEKEKMIELEFKIALVLDGINEIKAFIAAEQRKLDPFLETLQEQESEKHGLLVEAGTNASDDDDVIPAHVKIYPVREAVNSN